VKIVIIPLLMLLSVTVQAQSNYYHPADWMVGMRENAGILGNPASIELKTYAPNEQGEIGELLQLNYYEFDDNRVYRWEHENFDFDMQFIQMYEYMDIEDNRIYKREHFNEHGEYAEVTTYLYDEVHEDMVTEIKVAEYKQEEDPLEIEREFIIDIELDEDGVRRKDVTYKPDGTIQTEVLVNYNRIGLVSSKKRFRADGKWLWTDSLEYNPLFRVKKNVTLRPDRNGEKKIRVNEYEYNDDGSQLSMTNGEDNFSYRYDYDENYNWIRRYTSKVSNNETILVKIHERLIEYKK